MVHAKLLSATQNPMGLLKVAAGECYQKEATDKVIDHIVKAGHLSVLEHCYATFEVTCSIATLMQLTRHRHLSFTVQSSRVCHMDSVHHVDNLDIDVAIDKAMDNYHRLIAKGHSVEEAAYVLPKATEYKLVVTGNFRAWFEYLPKRLCKRASEEHRELATQIFKELKVVCPEVFKYCKVPCGDCKEKGCSFSG